MLTRREGFPAVDRDRDGGDIHRAPRQEEFGLLPFDSKYASVVVLADGRLSRFIML